MLRICAYHSNLYFPEFKSHVQEMKDKGFNVILFAITQTDILFNLVIFEEFADYARSEGMAVWANFWGWQGIGEAVCTETSPHKFLQAMVDIGIDDVMIDEPKLMKDIEWFTDCYDGFNFHLCLDDDTFNKLSDDQIKTMPVKMLGVSCYHWTEDLYTMTNRTDALTRRLNRLRTNDNFIFIQGFDIPYGMEKIPLVVKQIAESNGIVNFGFWSFRGTVTGTKRSVNRQIIWDSIKW